jgi:hypothetical protein
MNNMIRTVYEDFLIYKAKLFGPYYEYMSEVYGRLTITNDRRVGLNSPAWFLFKYGVFDEYDG